MRLCIFSLMICLYSFQSSSSNLLCNLLNPEARANDPKCSEKDFPIKPSGKNHTKDPKDQRVTCTGAEQGTFLSNVCWLMETEFDEVTPKVKLFLVEAQAYEMTLRIRGQTLTAKDRKELRHITIIQSINEKNCTVTYSTMKDKNTIRFNRVQPKSIKWEFDQNDVLKYTLRGNDFSADGRRKIVFFSDSVTPDRLERALSNLFSKYCKGLRSEF